MHNNVSLLVIDLRQLGLLLDASGCKQGLWWLEGLYEDFYFWLRLLGIWDNI